MKLTTDAIRLLLHELATALFDLGPDHERAPELRRQILSLMRVAKADARQTHRSNPPS
jgi:hypothetical protein